MSNHSELWEEQECAEAFGRDAMRMLEDEDEEAIAAPDPFPDDRFEDWQAEWPDCWFVPLIDDVFRGRVVDNEDVR